MNYEIIYFRSDAQFFNKLKENSNPKIIKAEKKRK